MTGTERTLRIELAAMYRIFAHLGWDELIYNHITVKIPDTDEFLINPYGLHYSQVTASNLLKVDINGQKINHSEYEANPAGMLIHSAIHSARGDMQCIAHTHTTAGMTVACQADGLRSDNFYSVLLHNQIAYHDFEGITVLDGEKDRLIASLGQKKYLILRNHGLLCGGTTIAECFAAMWLFERACEIQVSCDQTGKALIPISQNVLETSEQLLSIQMSGFERGRREFEGLRLLIEAQDSSFIDV